MAEIHKLDIETKTLVRVLSVVVAFFLGLSFLWATRNAITLIVLSFFLALALNPPVSYLARKMPRDSRVLGTTAAYLVVISMLGLLIWALVPPLVSQTNAFFERVPAYVEDLQGRDGALADFIERYNIAEEADRYVTNFTTRLGDSDGTFASSVNKVTSAVVTIISVLVITFLMLIEGPKWASKFWQLYDKPEREHHKKIANKMYRVVTGYVNGQVLLAALAGTTAFVALLVVSALVTDIPYDFPLAGLVAVLALIPLIGTTLGAAVAVLVALSQSFAAALIMLVFFIVYQQIENAVIQPVVQAKAINITPLLVFIAVIIGFSVGGLLGGFIAIPIAGCLRVLFLDFIDQRQKRSKAKA